MTLNSVLSILCGIQHAINFKSTTNAEVSQLLVRIALNLTTQRFLGDTCRFCFFGVHDGGLHRNFIRRALLIRS